MKKLMNRLLLSCRKATALVEKKLEVNLNKQEKLQLFMHTRLCQACYTYQKQSKKLDGLLRQQLQQTNPPATYTSQKSPHKLSSKAKKRLLKKIKEN